MDNQNSVNITISKPAKVIYFSDGVEEVMDENNLEKLQSVPDNNSQTIDPKTLPWGPWFSHYAWESGNKVLEAVDYAGESLAEFFGITTPKYQLEISEYERIQQEKKELEEESSGWMPQNTAGNIPLVLNEPVTSLENNRPNMP